MTLVRWNPIRDFSVLQNQMNRLFEDAMGTWSADSNGRGNTTTWVPLADIFENENDIIVKAELPGVDPKMVDVLVENNVLTIRGERPFEQKVEQEYHRLERPYGTFSRSFTLPATIDADKIRAEYRDGILNLSLPKSEKAKPKRIQIATTAA